MVIVLYILLMKINISGYRRYSAKGGDGDDGSGGDYLSFSIGEIPSKAFEL
jgi:hypothetical protein